MRYAAVNCNNGDCIFLTNLVRQLRKQIRIAPDYTYDVERLLRLRNKEFLDSLIEQNEKEGAFSVHRTEGKIIPLVIYGEWEIYEFQKSLLVEREILWWAVPDVDSEVENGHAHSIKINGEQVVVSRLGTRKHFHFL